MPPRMVPRRVDDQRQRAADIGATASLLAELPAARVLERIGLESRLASLRDDAAGDLPVPDDRAALLAAYDPWAHEPAPLAPGAPALRYREDAEMM